MSKIRSFDDELDESNAAELVAEILAVKPKCKILGCLLKVQAADMEIICASYLDQQDRLFHIIDEFLSHKDPKPTWRAILEALRNPLINSARLAEHIEQKYCFPSSIQSGNSAFSLFLPIIIIIPML